MMQAAKRNLRIHRGLNILGSVKWVVKYFKFVNQRTANSVKFFELTEEVEARKFARENKGIIYKQAIIKR